MNFSDYLPGTLSYLIGPWLLMLQEIPWLAILIEICLALLAVIIIDRIGVRILVRLFAPFPYSRRLIRYISQPARLAVFLVAVQIILRSNSDALTGMTLTRHLTALVLIAALTWLAVRAVAAVADTIVELNPAAEGANNFHARRIQTQSKVLARTIMVLIILLGAGFALMTLPMLRQIGASLLASAGLAGLVAGFAAKPLLGNLLAGMQLALTQPISLGDAVIVENEWGQVEEITGAYVVVCLWDQRRMIVPLQWFLERPFQNWTRTSSHLLGTVAIWADYRLPLDPIRKEAERICKASPEWDGKVCVTQMVDANERAMQFRVLISAADAGSTWELRCKIREGLIDFIQREYPEYLPRVRTEVAPAESQAHAEAGKPPDNLPGNAPQPASKTLFG